MRRILCALAVLGLAQAQQPAPFQSGKPLYVVIHVDIVPGPGGLAEPTKILQEFAAESRKDQGSVRFEIFQQDRPNHFTIVEAWQTREAFDAHTASEHTKRFRERIGPKLGSPFDERLHSLLP